MKCPTRFTIVTVFAGLAASAQAATPFTVTVQDINSNAPIPAQYALCKATPDGKSGPSINLRPTISWANAPVGTKVFAVVVSDPDVPADFSKAHKEGVTIGESDKRQLFYHWALTDIPANKNSIPGSKSETAPSFGTPTVNDLDKYVSDAHNYGGPCPPWNDMRVHHYHYTVYALDEPLNLPADTKAKDVVATLTGNQHVLAQNEVIGTYTLNKNLHK